MQIHIIADFVCPWCYIGKRQFEHALAQREDLVPQVHWLPFQLNPDMPEDGADREEYLSGKFGEEGMLQMDQKLKAYAEQLGLDLRLDRVARIPNTLAAHTLVLWAEESGVQHEVVDALFRANFVDGADIGDTDTLCRIAEEAGMDPEIIRTRLETGEDQDKVIEEDKMLRQMGVDAVPTTIVERKFVVSGAGGAEAFLEAFERAEQEQEQKELDEGED